MHKPKSWGEVYTTREGSKVGDNLISHIAMYDPYKNPTEPIGETGISLNDIKARIKERLDAVPKHYLSERMKTSALRYLTSYVLNTIGEHDKQVNVFDYIDHFTTQYIKDKTATYWSGKPQRSKIRTTKWMDKYFTPPSPDDKGPTASIDWAMVKEAIADGTMVYMAIDGDDMGKMVEEGLLTDDPEVARKISQDIQQAHEEIEKLTKAQRGEVIFDGGDNMLLYVPFDEDFFEMCRKFYIDETGHTATIGVGERPIQAHFSLVYGKNTGKNKVVVYSPEVEEELKGIKQEQEKLMDVNQKLKYKANANVSKEIKGALRNIGIPVDSEVVYATFIQVLAEYDLDDNYKIDQFFSQPTDQLVEKVRNIKHTKAEDQLEKTSQRSMTQSEKEDIYSKVDEFIVRIEGVNKALLQSRTTFENINPDMKVLYMGWDASYQEMSEKILTMLDMMDGQSFTYSEYLDKMYPAMAEAVAVAMQTSKEIEMTYRSLVNKNKRVKTEDEDESNPIDVSEAIDNITKLIDLMKQMSYISDMAILQTKTVHTADGGGPFSNEVRHTDDAVIIGPQKKKSRSRKYNWLTQEEMNPELDKEENSGDPSYMKNQFSDNMSESQFSMGGEPGNAVAPY